MCAINIRASAIPDIQIPAFSQQYIEGWMMSLEFWFGATGVTCDVLKYNTVLSQIPPKNLLDLKSAIAAVPETDKFEYIKPIIIALFTPTKTRAERVKHCLMESGIYVQNNAVLAWKRLKSNDVLQDFIGGILWIVAAFFFLDIPGSFANIVGMKAKNEKAIEESAKKLIPFILISIILIVLLVRKITNIQNIAALAWKRLKSSKLLMYSIVSILSILAISFFSSFPFRKAVAEIIAIYSKENKLYGLFVTTALCTMLCCIIYVTIELVIVNSVIKCKVHTKVTTKRKKKHFALRDSHIFLESVAPMTRP